MFMPCGINYSILSVFLWDFLFIFYSLKYLFFFFFFFLFVFCFVFSFITNKRKERYWWKDRTKGEMRYPYKVTGLQKRIPIGRNMNNIIIIKVFRERTPDGGYAKSIIHSHNSLRTHTSKTLWFLCSTASREIHNNIRPQKSFLIPEVCTKNQLRQTHQFYQANTSST